MQLDTQTQHSQAVKKCKDLFIKKSKDYGTAWRILRLPSFTDQIMIKARRIRTLQTLSTHQVPDSITTELIGIVNYSIMALIQIKLGDDKRLELPLEDLEQLYDACVTYVASLLKKKNNDYDEAWREMRVSSMVDIILMKLLRIKSIEGKEGKTIASEGVQAGYQDIVNYAVFCLIRLCAT